MEFTFEVSYYTPYHKRAAKMTMTQAADSESEAIKGIEKKIKQEFKEAFEIQTKLLGH